METIIYNIDSRHRDTSVYSSETNFSYELDSNIKNIISINLSSLEYGNTSHEITSAKGNNTFTATYSSVDYKFEIADGNYSSTDLIAKINEYFAAYVSSLTSEVDTNTGKVTISSGASAFSLSFPATTTDYNSLGQLLGFTSTSYPTSGSDTTSYTSENIMNVIGEHYYFLKLNDIGNINHNQKKYFCKMIMNAPKYEVAYGSRLEYVTKEVYFKQPINLKILDIKVVDTFNNIVIQNGIDFSFTLEFKVINNRLLKKYKELPFFSSELMKILLYDKMLEYFDYQLSLQRGKNESNSGIASTYLKLLNN